MLKVIKRDGAKAAYDSAKIFEACRRAATAAKYPQPEQLAEQITSQVEAQCRTLSQHNAPTGLLDIPTIQQWVEDALMHDYPEVARIYIQYRYDRDRTRAQGSELHAKLMGLVNKTDSEATTENANKDANVFPVMRDLMAGIVSKQFASTFLPKDILEAHHQGDIHFHDLDYSPFLPLTNCCLVDLEGMLKNGFRLGNAKIESPKSVGVACAVTAQIIAQVASHQYGGTTIPNLDQVLAPYVLKSHAKNLAIAHEYGITDPERYATERTEKEAYDGIQACEYEINTLFSSNGQQPFVTFSFGMGTSWAERIIQQSILRVRIKGLGKEGTTPVFPKLVFFIDEGINLKPTDPNYDIKQLALECTSKRMYRTLSRPNSIAKLLALACPYRPWVAAAFCPLGAMNKVKKSSMAAII
nr:anaerobic ribonucleoside-triphosphate reductase [Deefgea sp. CFH1-16]